MNKKTYILFFLTSFFYAFGMHKNSFYDHKDQEYNRISVSHQITRKLPKKLHIAVPLFIVPRRIIVPCKPCRPSTVRHYKITKKNSPEDEAREHFDVMNFINSDEDFKVFLRLFNQEQ